MRLPLADPRQLISRGGAPAFTERRLLLEPERLPTITPTAKIASRIRSPITSSTSAIDTISSGNRLLN